MSNSGRITEKIKDICTIIRLSRHIDAIASMPTYYPELEQKSKWEKRLDNFKWLCKYKELNYFYTSYGLDIKGFREAEEFLSNSEFRQLRNKGNRRLSDVKYGGYNYLALLRDKYVFAAHVSETIGSNYIPMTIGLFDHGRVYVKKMRAWLGLSDFFKEDSETVWKSIEGVFGEDVFLAHVSKGKIIIDEKAYSANEFLRSYGQKRFILQELIIQHPTLRAFQNRSVNTIRIITVKGKSGAINVLSAFLRVGIDNESFVDNRAKGGLAIGIGLETGKLMKYGFPHAKYGTKYDKHPLSGIVFEGYELPFWKETVKLVCDAHLQFYGFQSIGWDVAITQSGPLLIEGNDNWEISGPQDTSGGLKDRWNKLQGEF